MKKLFAVALLAVPFTFAQAPATSQAPTSTDSTAKAKKHNKGAKHAKKGSKTDAATPAASTPATK